MSRCASCSQWFIIGDAKTIQNGSRVHLKCALTINNNQINNNFTIIAPEPNIADVNPIIDPNDVHEEVRGAPILVGTWNCAVCTLINDTQNEMCELCGSFRDVAVPQNDIENEIQERWVCQICTFDSNHPIATYCAACGLDRGQQLPPPNILPAEHPGPAPEPALEPILEPPPVLVPVPALDLARARKIAS